MIPAFAVDGGLKAWSIPSSLTLLEKKTKTYQYMIWRLSEVYFQNPFVKHKLQTINNSPHYLATIQDHFSTWKINDRKTQFRNVKFNSKIFKTIYLPSFDSYTPRHTDSVPFLQPRERVLTNKLFCFPSPLSVLCALVHKLLIYVRSGTAQVPDLYGPGGA